MRISVLLCALCLSLGLSGFALAKSKSPLTRGRISLVPSRDRLKSAAAKDSAGWLLTDTQMIGAVDDHGGGIVSFDRQTLKRLLWAAPSTRGLSAPSLLYGDKVILSQRSGSVEALSLKDGKSLWKSELDKFVVRPITVAEGVAYAVSAEQTLYAIDLKDGSIKWSFKGERPAELQVAGASSPYVVARQSSLYWGLSSGVLLAINTQTGNLRWRVDLAVHTRNSRFVDVVGDLHLEADQLWVSHYDGFVSVVDVSAAHHPFRVVAQNLGTLASARTLGDGTYCVGTLSRQVICYDLAQEKPRWTLDVGHDVVRLEKLGNTLFAIGGAGRISAIDFDNAKGLWNDDLRASIAPGVFQLEKNSVYFATANKNLYGFSL